VLAARCCHVANGLTNFTGDRRTNVRTDKQEDIAITFDLYLVFLTVVRRHRQPSHDAADAVDSASGGGWSPTAGRVYASPSHLRAVCPSNHHVHCDKYDTAAAAGAYWFETSLRPSTANQLCWNQTVKFLAPSDDDLLTPRDPYAVERNWTAVSGTDPVTAVNI